MSRLFLCGSLSRSTAAEARPSRSQLPKGVGKPFLSRRQTTLDGKAFNILFRFVVTPMFLFSGTFYPVSRLPEWGQWLAYATPLWHGTQLARDAGSCQLAAIAEPDADRAGSFLKAAGLDIPVFRDVDALAKDVEGKFISAFVRATKPAAACCAQGCCV